MKLIIALMATATVAIAPGTQAATYSVTTNTAQEAAITAARAAYNSALPACATSCASDPNFQATNSSYLLSVLTSAMTSWAKLATVDAALPTADQTNAETLLAACVSANGIGGLTALQCQSLLTDVQGAK